jgi:hypothetical protein
VRARKVRLLNFKVAAREQLRVWQQRWGER